VCNQRLLNQANRANPAPLNSRLRVRHLKRSLVPRNCHRHRLRQNQANPAPLNSRPRAPHLKRSPVPRNCHRHRLRQNQALHNNARR
jgi:hypothetical protein